MHNGNNSKLGMLLFLLQRQRIRPNFMTGTRRTLIQSKHSRGSAKLRMFLFIQLRQLIQPNFMTDTIRTFTISNTTETTHILEYSYSNYTQKRQPKQLNCSADCYFP